MNQLIILHFYNLKKLSMCPIWLPLISIFSWLNVPGLGGAKIDPGMILELVLHRTKFEPTTFRS